MHEAELRSRRIYDENIDSAGTMGKGGGGVDQCLRSDLCESFLPEVKGRSLHGHDKQSSKPKYLQDN